MSAKIRILLLATAGILLGWWFWPVQPSYANFPPTATGPWVAFGDSLTAGYGAEPGHDYPALVGRKLGVEIKNFGQYGDTTRNGLDRVETVVKVNRAWCCSGWAATMRCSNCRPHRPSAISPR